MLAVNKPIVMMTLISLGECCVVNTSRIVGELHGERWREIWVKLIEICQLKF